MPAPARSETFATRIVAAMSEWVDLPLPLSPVRCPRVREARGRRAKGFAAVLSILAAATAGADAADITTLRVNTFPNAKALPVHVAIAKSMFAKYGLAVEVESTESSQSQRDGLAAGRFQIAHAALDNAVAMIEVAKRDVIIVSVGDSGMNEFFVQPEISSFADLRG